MLRHDLKKAVCNPYFFVCVIVATVLLIQKTMENWGGSQDMNGLLGSLLYTSPLYNFIHDNQMTEALISEPLQEHLILL